MFNNTDINNHFAVWRELKLRLKELGYELLTADDNQLENTEFVFFLDSLSIDGTENLYAKFKSYIKKHLRIKGYKPWPNKELYTELKKNTMMNKAVLFLWEGRSVNPSNYRKDIWDRFKYIFTWNDDLVDNIKFFKFCLPATLSDYQFQPISFNQKKFLVNITANKYSSDSKELYTARRNTIEYFTINHPKDFDLFGVRWNKPVTLWQRHLPFLTKKYSSYKGTSNNKIETLSKYKFTLAYENMNEANGYITEKIFDALIAKTVPIYWGAENIEEYVNPKAFIDRRIFKNDADLADYIYSISEDKYNEMLEAGQNYLKSEQFSKFLPGSFCDQIISVLKLNSTK
jgi:hypothetical protein